MWAWANTPPGYRNIGFPDTQEVGDIDKRAEEMHRKKREEVEREVGCRGGKNRRRRGVQKEIVTESKSCPVRLYSALSL